METKTSRKRDCFEIHGMYFDDDGIVFGECEEVIQIESFRGARNIKELPAYALELHEDPDMRQRLVSNGRKFLAFRGSHHRQYQGHMFVPKDDELIQVHADGRVMVDAASFRRISPNYPRFQDRRPVKLRPYYTVLETVDRITGNCVNPDEMEEEDLARCSPTVLGFCLDNKYWGEFALDLVEDITFSTGLFDMLEISEDKKQVVRSLTESCVLEAKRTSEDDIIVGKGQGVIVLLHGPPGVGKTLTAEAIAEDLQCLLYSISSGELRSDAESLEHQLGDIFDTAAAWNAILLLDEADVYLKRRDGLYLERNRLVATFLRTLEYYRGIFFLTTNLVEEFDEAVLNRVHLKLPYDDLKAPARRRILDRFLKAARADIQEADLETFAEIPLDGRKIKNVVKIARSVASSKGIQLSATYVRMTLRTNGYNVPAQGSAKFDASLYEN
ncbi:P-loop containing nucleoside triphosphate hydrolase protein [Aspergillus novoparasiticus]|uniref:P-loop containing nucleoside triphosphate hydrolase protein n=1 Tax=Aspergillus novoparasiticus TaxID=986946 RepID=A0A5N6F0T5_9EURO|nr:P-loop containing nucleoside triphosphate hydrolase protein [Aspergillus novoparasiticus]